jgi:hypothetical protein
MCQRLDYGVFRSIVVSSAKKYILDTNQESILVVLECQSSHVDELVIQA